MKKIFHVFSLTLASSLLAIGAWAQKVNVTTAYNEMRDGDFVEAREYIDKAIEDPKTKAEEKTWRYRGLIYNGLADSEEANIPKAEAINEAIESFKKAIELDEKEKWLQENRTGLAKAQNKAVNMGIEAYNAKEYGKARDLFVMGELAAADLGVVDTLAMYNAGLAAEQAGDLEGAIEQYEKAIGVGYLGPKMYLYTANIYQKKDDQEGYLNIVQEGRSHYPENADLIVYELNYYLRNQKFAEAKENLKLAIEKEPENKQLHFSLGVVHDNLGETEKAEAAYKRALELDPNYFDAVYNLGALYFNKGVEMNSAANEIEDNQEYAAEKERVKEVFVKALPYLEKAHELQPDDRGAIASLTQLYALMDKTDKYMEMKAKLEGEGAGQESGGNNE